MIIKSLPLLVLVAVVGLVGLFALNSPAVAQQSIERSFSSNQVSPGEVLTVTISNLGLGSGTPGNLEETIPDGFTFLPGDTVVTPGIGSGAISGRVITFTLLGGDTLTYKVSVDSNAAAGRVHFSGTLTPFGGTAQNIVGDDEVTIAAVAQDTPTPEPTAEPTAEPTPDSGTGPSRALPSSDQEPGSTFDVTIDNVGLGGGGFGQIEETLPAGFSYVDGSASVVSGANGATIGGTTSGQVVTLTLLGVESLTYQVAVGGSVADGSHSFSGIFKDSPASSGVAIGGDQSVSVMAPVPMPIGRSFSDDPVQAGDQVTVTIDNIGLGGGGFGQIEETLPTAVSFVANSEAALSGANGAAVTASASGQTVTFTLLGTESISYDVTVDATAADGDYDFMGVFRDTPGATGTAIEGDGSLRVGPDPTPVPTATPEPTPEPTPVPGTTPTAPTRTPRPTAVPPAPATPVAIEKVDATAVEGATVVEPDMSATVSSADGMATVMLPNTSRARTYQVMVVTDAANCEGADGALKACAMVKVFDAEGNLESDVELIRRATVVITLSSSMVDDLGGLPVVFQANALGAFSVQQMSAAGTWSDRGFSMGLSEDGGVMVTVTGLRSLGSVALTVDEDILQTAMYQVAGITPTPVVPPTPEPTATPEPEPTAVPADTAPVGDATAPVGLLIVLALTGALMVYTGTRVMRGRRSAVR